jgi:thiamine-phosphate pyrophosphorylase
LDKLREVTRALDEFPIVAIGGLTLENVGACFEAGASGVAAIRLFNDVDNMKDTISKISARWT